MTEDLSPCINSGTCTIALHSFWLTMLNIIHPPCGQHLRVKPYRAGLQSPNSGCERHTEHHLFLASAFLVIRGAADDQHKIGVLL